MNIKVERKSFYNLYGSLKMYLAIEIVVLWVVRRLKQLKAIYVFFSWYQGLSTLAAEHPKRFCSMSVTNPSRCQLSHCRTFSNLPQCSDIIIQFMSLRILEKQHVFQHRPKLWRWNRIHHLEKNMSNQIVIVLQSMILA